MATTENRGASEADIVLPCHRNTGQFAQGMGPAVAVLDCAVGPELLMKVIESG
jgi:hypothetical protein